MATKLKKNKPRKNATNGEKKISACLNKRHILAESEKSFDDLVGTGGGKLRFDFYCPNKKTAIEFQGPQHYKVVYGDIDRLHKQIVNDNRKRRYCSKNGIKLIEIPYTEYKNIEKILDKKL